MTADPNMPMTPLNPTGDAANARDPGRSMLGHELLLGQRLHLHAMARFGVVIAIVVGALVARYLVGVADLDVVALIAIAASIALYNTGMLVLIARTDTGRLAPRRHQVRRLLVHISIVLDFMALAAALWFVGGVRSPFLAFFLFHIVIASILLSRRDALTSTVLAAVMLAILAFAEASGVLPPRTPSGAVPDSGMLDGRYLATVFVVYLTLFVLLFLSQTHLAEGLRQAERAVHERAIQLEKLSGMRRDFLFVALHDVGSPVGAAALLLRNLRDGLCGDLEPPQLEQVQRALAKLDSIEALVRDLRLLGELDTATLDSHSTEIPLSFLLAEVIEECEDIATHGGVSIEADPSQPAALVYGVPRLLKEAIFNYVTNAIKYTPSGGRITARVESRPGVVRVEVSDTGVGIAPDDQRRLFEEFVRVGRDHPQVKRVRGTGLGLSIVRRIAEAHHGRVGVNSELGKGSTFWIELPACTGSEAAPA